METKLIKIHEDTAKKLDALRGAGITLTYDQIINALIQARYLLRLLAKGETKSNLWAYIMKGDQW